MSGLKYNVNVNAIVPGYIATDMNTALINDPDRSRQILERIPADCWEILMISKVQ